MSTKGKSCLLNDRKKPRKNVNYFTCLKTYIVPNNGYIFFFFLLRIFACFFQHASGRSRVLFHQEQLHNAKAANTIVCMVRKSGTGSLNMAFGLNVLFCGNTLMNLPNILEFFLTNKTTVHSSVQNKLYFIKHM